MSEKTHADIIAEMRKTKYGDEECKVKWCLIPWADDLDAAHRRELDALNKQIADLRQQRDLWSKRAAELVEKCNEQYAKLKQVGNAAKLREALITIRDKAHEQYVNDYGIDTVWIQDVANAALAAPARNCEVGTAEEQSARFRKFCKKGSMDTFEATAYCAYECPCGNNYDCKLAWAQMPYKAKEGGEK